MKSSRYSYGNSNTLYSDEDVAEQDKEKGNSNTKIKEHTAQSTAIDSIEYNPETQDLDVTFRSGSTDYRFPNVPKEVVLSVPVLPDGFTIEKKASQGGSVVISSPTAFSYFSVQPTGTAKDGGLDVTKGSLGNVDRNSYICIFSDSNYNTLIGMGRWRDYEALAD